MTELLACENCDRWVDLLVKVGGYKVCFSCESKHYELHNKDGWR